MSFLFHPLLLLLLLLLVCFFHLAAPLAKAAEHHLAASANDTDVVAELEAKFMDLFCPSSHPVWFVPRASVGLQLNAGNRLRVGLEEPSRPFQRGLYTCCPRARALQPRVALQHVRTPACCPCCSWPEEEYCAPDLWNTSASLEAPFCMQIFLFTGVVPCREANLPLPWRSRALIPCPAPLPTSVLQIYSQLPKIKQSRSLWFDASSAGVGEFDPRYGVCTTQQRIPGGHRQLTCEYPTARCTVKPTAPFAPPTILPNVTCRIDPIGQEFAMSRQTVPALRVRGPRNLTLACTALYANIFVAMRPPTLCFRWRSVVESSERPASTWSRYECVKSERAKNSATVSSTSTYHLLLPAGQPATRVEVEVVERNRATPVQAFSLRIRVSPASLGNRIFVEVVRPAEPTAYSLFSDASTRNQTLVLLNTSLSRLTLGFYALDEVAPNSCSSPTLGKQHFVLNRTTDKWLCHVTLPASNFDVLLRQGALVTRVAVYPSPAPLLPRSAVAGLRGSVDVPINVTCPLTRSETPPLLNTTPRGVRWLVYRGDELVNETYTNASWLLIAPLVNSTAVAVEPVLEWSSPTAASLLDFHSNLSALSLPPVVAFSRRLCVSCETFFSLGGSSVSTRRCVTLETREEPQEENLSAVEAALRRFSPAFVPIQVSNVSNPSFRVTTAFPAGNLQMNGTTPRLDIYAGSILELRCSMGRTSGATRWPLISFAAYDGTRSFPDGTLQLYALPFTLESRLRVNSSAVKTSEVGAYLCRTADADAVALLVDIVPSRMPEVVEPNHPVRYFTSNEIIRLTCRAVGGPGPLILWRLVNRTAGHEAAVLKRCNESHLREESSCSLVYVPPPLAENVTIECEAMNYLGNAIATLSMIRVNTNNELAGSVLFSRLWKNYVFWIIVPLVVIVCFFVCLGTCLWRKSRQMVKVEKLIKMDNLIYGRPHKVGGVDPAGVDPFCEEMFCGLMPTRELRERWCLDRRNLRPFSQPLGNGHYGTVQKGIYYGPREKGRRRADAFFVALKSPSTEIASLSCFRNEIAHLMRLSEGPNIVKMIGCAFGEKGDLRDTLLVLEFCPNTSLSDFIRRMLYPRGCYDNRPVFVRNAEGEISTGSARDCTTPLPSSDSSASQFAWEAHGAPKWRGKRRRRGAAGRAGPRGRRNTALVYQRLTHNSSSIFLRIATGIARGLEFLAQNNVIHRDLATRNVLMDAKYEPKICDFGLAVTVDSPHDCTDGASQQRSTGCYHILTFTKQLPFRILPPEALSRQLFYLSSDIWEFGLLLWQMFFFETRKPFENIQGSDALLRLLSSDRCPPNGLIDYFAPGASDSGLRAPPTIDRPPAISDSLWAVICDCLRFRAAERPSAAEVCRRLDDCYAVYEEVGGVSVAAEQTVNYRVVSLRAPSHEDVCGDSPFVQDVFHMARPRLATYENIEQARNSAGYLESFPSSSV